MKKPKPPTGNRIVDDSKDDDRQKSVTVKKAKPPAERNGPKGPEPTRFCDWNHNGRCIDF